MLRYKSKLSKKVAVRRNQMKRKKKKVARKTGMKQKGVRKTSKSTGVTKKDRSLGSWSNSLHKPIKVKTYLAISLFPLKWLFVT
jgi:hypothetical protein